MSAWDMRSIGRCFAHSEGGREGEGNGMSSSLCLVLLVHGKTGKPIVLAYFNFGGKLGPRDVHRHTHKDILRAGNMCARKASCAAPYLILTLTLTLSSTHHSSGENAQPAPSTPNRKMPTQRNTMARQPAARRPPRRSPLPPGPVAAALCAALWSVWALPAPNGAAARAGSGAHSAGVPAAQQPPPPTLSSAGAREDDAQERTRKTRMLR